MSFETFDEGAGNEMVPRCDVTHVLARAYVSFCVNHLASPEIECETFGGARHRIKCGWRRGGGGRGNWALGFAVTFPERSFGGEQVLCEACLHAFCGDVIEENAGFGGASGCCARRCRDRDRCSSVRVCSAAVPLYAPVKLEVLEEGLAEGGEGGGDVRRSGDGGQDR